MCDSVWEYSLIMLGNTNVGKSSIIKRIISESATELTPTNGTEYTVKTIRTDLKYIRLTICDTSGQARFRHLLHLYYKISNSALVVYDIQDRDSFEIAKSWVKELREQAEPDMIIALAGNKSDMKANRAISRAEADCFAADNNLIFLEITSMQDGLVQKIFEAIALALFNQEKLRIKQYKTIDMPVGCYAFRKSKPYGSCKE